MLFFSHRPEFSAPQFLQHWPHSLPMGAVGSQIIDIQRQGSVRHRHSREVSGGTGSILTRNLPSCGRIRIVADENRQPPEN